MKTVENVSLRDSIEYIFGDKGKDRIANISFNGIDDAQDMFVMCVKLMLGGVCHAMGVDPEQGEADISKMTEEQFKFVCHQLFRTGIQVVFEATQNDEYNMPSTGNEESGSNGGVKMEHKVLNDDASKLDNYILIVRAAEKKYIIGFALMLHDEENFT